MEFGPAATQEFYGYRKIKDRDCDYCTTAGDASACGNPCSTWRSVSLIIMMVCFIAATPLSLVLTLPAYILADRVSENTSHYASVYVPHMIFTELLASHSTPWNHDISVSSADKSPWTKKP